MSEKEKKDIKQTVDVLMQLDKNSLLIIDSGAKMLMARQNMDKEAICSNSQPVDKEKT